jgi:hypothetical protein
MGYWTALSIIFIAFVIAYNIQRWVERLVNDAVRRVELAIARGVDPKRAHELGEAERIRTELLKQHQEDRARRVRIFWRVVGWATLVIIGVVAVWVLRPSGAGFAARRRTPPPSGSAYG